MRQSLRATPSCGEAAAAAAAAAREGRRRRRRRRRGGGGAAGVWRGILRRVLGAARGLVHKNAVPKENQKRSVQACRGAGQVREEGDVASAEESHAFIHPAWSNNSKTN